MGCGTASPWPPSRPGIPLNLVQKWLGHAHRPADARRAATHGLRTAEIEQMRALVRDLRAGAKRLVELT
jgi:hypothetical protein